jgi:hypothetical protein
VGSAFATLSRVETNKQSLEVGCSYSGRDSGVSAAEILGGVRRMPSPSPAGLRLPASEGATVARIDAPNARDRELHAHAGRVDKLTVEVLATDLLSVRRGPRPGGGNATLSAMA